jgi:AhpD family alkylhydroperoxidase
MMPIFKPITEKYAKGKVKKIFDDIKKIRKIKKIPNFWKTLANEPDTLERTWNSLQQVMKKGALDSLTKELIYVAVSITNSCEYCIKSHSLAAKKKGATNKMLNEMIAVVGMANETNKLVEGYQVRVDNFLK